MSEQKADKEFINMVRENEAVIFKVASFYADKDNPLGDLYQEIVLNLWKSFANFRGESKRSTWIYRIALNTCISFFRRSVNKPAFVNIAPDVADMEYQDDNIKELYRLINRLEKLERALVLLYLDDRSYQEISEITGLSVTNVATKLSRIKEKLKKMSNS